MEKEKIHVISNTHWDREHRHVFQETRIMLVQLFDELIEIMETDPEYRFFTLDGQSIILDDYLEVKHMVPINGTFRCRLALGGGNCYAFPIR